MKTTINYVKQFTSIRFDELRTVTKVYYSTGKVREYTNTIPKSVDRYINSAEHIVRYRVIENGITIFTLFINEGEDWDEYKDLFETKQFFVVSSSTDTFFSAKEFAYCENDVNAVDTALETGKNQIENNPITIIDIKTRFKLLKALYRASLRDRLNAYNETLRENTRERHKRILELMYNEIGAENAYKFTRMYADYIMETKVENEIQRIKKIHNNLIDNYIKNGGKNNEN